MKLNRGIKFYVISTFMIFIALIIVVCFVFQVFLIDDIYLYVKKWSMQNDLNRINTIIKQDDYEEELNKLIENTDYEIYVLNQYHRVLYYNNSQRQLMMANENVLVVDNVGEIESLQAKASKNKVIGKTYFYKESKKNLPPEENKTNMINHDKRIEDTLCMINVNQEDNDQKIVILLSRVIPLATTVETIQVQLFVTGAFMAIIALIVAFYITNKLVKPLVNINESAKRLSIGEYEVSFDGKGYKEIEELSATLNHTSKELVKVEQLRRELIANMSHDLRTPLTMISGYGEIMRDIPGENTPENVQIIIDEAKKLTTIVNDILDLSKLQSSQMQLEISKFNITNEIKDMVYRFNNFLKKEDIQIEFIYDQEILIEADYTKMLRAIYNLLINSVNYCGDDKIVIIKQLIDESTITYQFIDHGEGISQQDLPFIWDRYYKVDKNHQRGKVGSGIGLSIVKEILDLHHFEYGVESEVGKGTTFYFTIKKLS